MIVEIHGVARDVASRQTAVITNNGNVCAGPGWGQAVGAVDLALNMVSALLGFNPWWDTEFEFEVTVPDLALVRFMVEDYDSSSRNDFIGQSTIPWNSLKQGERWRGGACWQPWAGPHCSPTAHSLCLQHALPVTRTVLSLQGTAMSTSCLRLETSLHPPLSL